MATAADPADLTSDLKCIICTKRYEDPRLLSCGHHFCLTCLEKLITGENITCPTCRHVTQVNKQDGVRGLTKYKLTNQFTESVNSIKEKEYTQKPCELCKGGKNAAKTCLKCWINLCDDCMSKHEQDLKHKMYPMTRDIFCQEHNDKGVMSYCLKY